jgi:hypothetical protein
MVADWALPHSGREGIIGGDRKAGKTMREARRYLEEVRENVAKMQGQQRVTPAENALFGMIDGLAGLQLQLMERVAALEAAARGVALPGGRAGAEPGKERPDAAPVGTPGARPEVGRDVAGEKTGEPLRTEAPTGRSSEKTTDMDRGIA